MLVRGYSVFQDLVGEKVIEVSEGSTVEDVLRLALGRAPEDLHVKPLVFVNDKPAGLKDALRDGDVLLVFPPFSGG